MAYNERGEWYFDPATDMDDQELYNDELKRQHVREVVKKQKQTFQQQQEFGNLWNEVLKEEGLDPQSYEELFAADPAAAKTHFKTAMKHVASNIKRGKPVAKGKASQEVQQQRTSAESRAKLESLREKSRKGPLSHEDELDVIDALFGDGLL